MNLTSSLSHPTTCRRLWRHPSISTMIISMPSHYWWEHLLRVVVRCYKSIKDKHQVEEERYNITSHVNNNKMKIFCREAQKKQLRLDPDPIFGGRGGDASSAYFARSYIAIPSWESSVLSVMDMLCNAANFGPSRLLNINGLAYVGKSQVLTKTIP